MAEQINLDRKVNTPVFCSIIIGFQVLIITLVFLNSNLIWATLYAGFGVLVAYVSRLYFGRKQESIISYWLRPIQINQALSLGWTVAIAACAYPIAQAASRYQLIMAVLAALVLTAGSFLLGKALAYDLVRNQLLRDH